MKKRLFCLDLLRGLDIFYLLVIHYGLLLGGVFRVWPLKTTAAKAFFTHSLTAFVSEPGVATTGFGLLDFAQPLFVFVTGVSASLAMAKFVTADGTDQVGFWSRLVRRTAMLWALGSIIRGALTFKLFTGSDASPNFCLYSDTLHTIAVAYFAASVGLQLRRAWLRFAVGMALIGGTATVMALCGDYTRLGNAARLIEDTVYGWMGGHAKDFCYLLTTFTWAGMGILASLVGDLMKSDRAPWTKAKWLAWSGVGSFVLGWVLSFWVPPIRYIYTVSFVFETFGLSLLLLDACYVVTDIRGWRRGTWLLILFGQCSLAGWVLMMFFGDALAAASNRIVCGLPKLLGSSTYQPLFFASVRAALLVWLLWQWRRLREVRKRPAQGA